MKFIFLDFFQFFLTSNDTKRSNLYQNDQIYIQTIKFKFKQTNQELTAHYRPLTPVAGGSAALTPGPAPVQTVPPGPGGHCPYCPVPLPRLPGRAVPPD
jgi:hypothetical protein